MFGIPLSRSDLRYRDSREGRLPDILFIYSNEIFPRLPLLRQDRVNTTSGNYHPSAPSFPNRHDHDIKLIRNVASRLTIDYPRACLTKITSNSPPFLPRPTNNPLLAQNISAEHHRASPRRYHSPFELSESTLNRHSTSPPSRPSLLPILYGGNPVSFYPTLTQAT